ncbi:MAG: DUF3135 domain-containing protein [Pseudomonadales bacterium]
MKPRLPAFDVLVDMARNDPQGLETLRRSLTDAVIATASNETARRRLRGLQFRVDMERRRAGTPLAATIRISEMMCHSLADLHRSMVAPESWARQAATDHATNDSAGAASAGTPAADNVIPLFRGLGPAPEF